MNNPKIKAALSQELRIVRDPTVAEIAARAGVGTATVDRILNERPGVREPTRRRVLAALEELRSDNTKFEDTKAKTLRINFVTDSGKSFHETLEDAVKQIVGRQPDIVAQFEAVTTARVDPIKLANILERSAESADAMIVVAREDLIINRVIRSIVARGVPVICLTTDLPASGRLAYVGNDQTASGATAAYLMGQAVRNKEGNILLVYSAPYRVQEERELGFRRVLRAEYPQLSVDERVNSNDDSDFVYENVVRYVHDHGPPVGIYNVAAGNIGIGKALKENSLDGKTVFIGHELNSNSRLLLETGVMNFLLGHDVVSEVEQAISQARKAIGKAPFAPTPFSKIRIYTKYSCN